MNSISTIFLAEHSHHVIFHEGARILNEEVVQKEREQTRKRGNGIFEINSDVSINSSVKKSCDVAVKTEEAPGFDFWYQRIRDTFSSTIKWLAKNKILPRINFEDTPDFIGCQSYLEWQNARFSLKRTLATYTEWPGNTVISGLCRPWDEPYWEAARLFITLVNEKCFQVTAYLIVWKSGALNAFKRYHRKNSEHTWTQSETLLHRHWWKRVDKRQAQVLQEKWY